MALYRMWVDARCTKLYTGVGIVVDVVADGRTVGHHEAMFPAPRLNSVAEAELMSVLVGMEFLRSTIQPTEESSEITVFSDNDRALRLLHGEDKPKKGTREGEILKMITDRTAGFPAPLYMISYNRVLSAKNRAHAVAARSKKAWGEMFKGK